MAMSDAEKLDHLWKAFNGLAKTAAATTKSASNETIPSPTIVYPSVIWAQAADITAVAPVATTAIIEVRAGAQRIRMTSDPTSPPNVAWLATTAFNNPASRIGEFIPSSFGSAYAVRVFIGDPNTGPAARIFPDTTNEEWVFNYAAGVLTFPNNVPGTKPASIGSGNVNTGTAGIYIEAYRYVGTKGGGGSGGTVNPDDFGTMAFQDANSVNITGGVISGVTIDGGEF